MYHNSTNKKGESHQSMSTHYKQEHNILISSRNGLAERKVLITIDNSIYNLKITLSDESDIFFLYSVNITHEDYLVLKSEQGLLINFPDFPDQIVNLLKLCNTGKMYLQLISVNVNSFNLEFIERNDFKNLMHLQLKMFACENDDILANISLKMNKYKETIQNLEKKNELLNSEVSSLIKDNEALCRGINETENKVRKECADLNYQKEAEFKKKYAELERQILKQREEHQNLICSNKELNVSNKSLKTQNVQYATTIENMNKEISKLENDVRSLKMQNTQLENNIKNKDSDVHTARTNLAVLEQSLKEKIDVIAMLKEALTRSEKEIEALRSSSNIKSEQEVKLKSALKQTSEDLIKANQIIATNNTNYDQLKKKNNIVSKILIKLEKDHTGLQKEFEDKLKILEHFQRDLEERDLELRKYRDEHSRLVKLLKTKDESLDELKQVVQKQQNKLNLDEKQKENIPVGGIIPVAPEWKPLPSPITPKTNAASIPATAQTARTTNILLNSNRNSKKMDPKFPSSYFKLAEAKTNKKC